jgi:hypothetical protein
MIELSITCVNLPAAQVSSPRRAASATSHSAARLEAVYTSREYGRRALPVEANTSCDAPASSAAAMTCLVPSTLVVTVRWTSRSASPGSRCAARWNTTSGRTAPKTAARLGRSLMSAWTYCAPATRGHPLVTPRLTLTSRAGRNRAICAISVEPMQPVPPVTRTVAPPSQPASSASGTAMPRRPRARNLVYSSPASGLAAISVCVRLRSSPSTLSSSRCCPGGAASRIAEMISEGVANAVPCPLRWASFVHSCP